MKNVVLIGRGAVGAVYAVALSKALGNENFRVAADAERCENYRKVPFYLNQTPHTFNYFTPTAGDQAADLIIIATKWGGYADALELIAPLVGEQTVILPLLNGMLAYDQAAERFGEQRVLRGFYIGHTATRTDQNGRHVVCQDGSYRTHLGRTINEKPYHTQVERVCQLFELAGIKYRVDQNMLTAQWQKLIMNIGTNQPTALYRYNYGEFTNSPEALALSRALMDEAQDIAVALGVPEADALTDRALQAFSILAHADYSSMAQDVLADRPTENDIFAGYIIELGRKLHIATPQHNRIYSLFHINSILPV